MDWFIRIWKESDFEYVIYKSLCISFTNLWLDNSTVKFCCVVVVFSSLIPACELCVLRCQVR